MSALGGTLQETSSFAPCSPALEVEHPRIDWCVLREVPMSVPGLKDGGVESGHYVFRGAGVWRTNWGLVEVTSGFGHTLDYCSSLPLLPQKSLPGCLPSFSVSVGLSD